MLPHLTVQRSWFQLSCRTPPLIFSCFILNALSKMYRGSFRHIKKTVDQTFVFSNDLSVTSLILCTWSIIESFSLNHIDEKILRTTFNYRFHILRRSCFRISPVLGQIRVLSRVNNFFIFLYYFLCQEYCSLYLVERYFLDVQHIWPPSICFFAQVPSEFLIGDCTTGRINFALAFHGDYSVLPSFDISSFLDFSNYPVLLLTCVT